MNDVGNAILERIQATVEGYRQRLGLLPWKEFAASCPDPSRGTGKTLGGLLVAIARCQVFGISLLFVDGYYYGAKNNHRLCALAKDLCAEIGLVIEVEPASRLHRGLGKYVLYIDGNHHDIVPPKHPLYDGLTAEQCLERYEAQQQDREVVGRDGSRLRPPPLTSSQLLVARELWSVRLKERVKS